VRARALEWPKGKEAPKVLLAAALLPCPIYLIADVISAKSVDDGTETPANYFQQLPPRGGGDLEVFLEIFIFQ
jgi:hypothetical protein